MRHLNLDTVEITHDADDPEGYRAGRARIGRLLGAEQAGASLYELPPGQGNCPYHYEVGDEEWLLVLAGRLTVRHPDGEDELGAGRDRPVPGAAPTAPTSSRTAARRRSACSSFSVDHTPAVSVYPDSDKVGTFTDDPAATSWSAADVADVRRTWWSGARSRRRLGQAAGAPQRADGGAAAGSQPARAAARGCGVALAAPVGQRHAGRNVALDVVDLARRTHRVPIVDRNESGPERETRILGCECPTSDLQNTSRIRAGAATCRPARTPARPAARRAATSSSLRVAVAGDRVADAGFEASGCGATIAAASAAVELVERRAAPRGRPREQRGDRGRARRAERRQAPRRRPRGRRAAPRARRRGPGRRRARADPGRTLVAMSGGVDSAVAALRGRGRGRRRHARAVARPRERRRALVLLGRRRPRRPRAGPPHGPARTSPSTCATSSGRASSSRGSRPTPTG